MEKKLDNQQKTIEELLKKVELLDNEKHSKQEFAVDLNKVTGMIEKLRLDSENHGNHFAMIENFVEKYIPIRIQSTISEVLSLVLPYRERNKLADYEKKRFKELHEVILDDDGIPQLID